MGSLETLKNYLQDYTLKVTEKSKGANMYVCPVCHSGEGKNGTGAFSLYNDNTKFKCFSCGINGDIFDLYELTTGETNKSKQLEELSAMFRVTTNNTSKPTTTPIKEKTDYSNFFLKAHKDISKTDYLKKRGLGDAVINKFAIGYIEEWTHPKVPNAPKSPRIIIPTSQYSYLARDTRDNIDEAQKPYSKSKVGEISIFNKGALKTAQKPIFIVEGEIDALSIIEVGGEAVALGTITIVKKFLEEVKTSESTQPFIISLDNDSNEKTKAKVEKAVQEIEEGLQALNIKSYRYNISGKYKDPNEALVSDRQTFIEAVRKAENIPTSEEQEKKEKYLKTATAYYLQDFINGIAESVNTPCISTGFTNLDNILDGGLYEGLYVIGAISSLGKTTLVSQIVDQIAEKNTDVLIFSLEMARSEIISKSISRNTAKNILVNGGDVRYAKTSRGITTGARYTKYSQAEIELINKSIKDYEQYARNIYISEGVGDIGVMQIREAVKQHILYTGKTPVVVVDYLQILAPYNEKYTDKQNIDRAIIELKRISRDYKTPVIGISSFNRASYKESVTMESFKESGAIEYSSDVLIGLQLKGVGDINFNLNEAKSKEPREIELLVLKNRNGKTGAKANFKYYAIFNYFVEEDNSENKITSKNTL